MGEKKEYLRKKDAAKIVDFTVALAKELEIFGSVAVVNQSGDFMSGDVIGKPRPTTYVIATNKADQSAYTGARTGTTAELVLSKQRTLRLYGIDPEKFVPFAGGCPIYTVRGILIGGAGFSEQTGVTDERIIAAAIEACGFLSDTPKMEDIPLEKIQKAAEKVKGEMEK